VAVGLVTAVAAAEAGCAADGTTPAPDASEPPEGPETPQPETGAPVEDGSGPDVSEPDPGPADAALPDAGAEVDAAGPDAELDAADDVEADAGPEIDAPEPDAGVDAVEVVEPEAFPACEETCDPIAGTGCPEEGTCTYLAGEPCPACALKGDVAAGEPCSAEATCAEGICLSVNGGEHRCYTFCAGEEDCEGGEPCLSLDGLPYDVCKVPGVLATCDLLDAASCPEGKGCYAVEDEPLPVCLPAGDLAEGAACGKLANACLPGLVCVETCRPLCDPEAAVPACGEGEVCVPYVEGAGFCLPP
jgi:hypothetical protein